MEKFDSHNGNGFWLRRALSVVISVEKFPLYAELTRNLLFQQ